MTDTPNDRVQFHENPDGPVQTQLYGYISDGVVIRSATVPAPDGSKVPALVFDFRVPGSDGIGPIMLVHPVETMLAFRELVHNAVQSAVRAARNG